MTALFSENFDNFTGTGFAPTPEIGKLDSDNWKVTGLSDGNGTFGGTFAADDFARGTSTGTVGTGGVYGFDVGSGNTILGIQPGGPDFTPGDIVLKFTNSTSSAVNALDVSYTIWYRNDQNRGNSLNFAWSTDDSTYTGISALDFTTPAAADPSPTWQNVLRSTTISGLNLAAGAEFYLRWRGDDVDGSGSRDEYGIDVVTVSTPIANTAPELTDVAPTVTFAENTLNAAAQLIDSDVTLTDTNSINFDGGNITVSYLSGGSFQDTLFVRNQGTGVNEIGLDGRTVKFGGTNIGQIAQGTSLDGTGGSNLVISLNANATPAAVEALIENLTYRNTSNTPTASRTIQITVNDGDGGTSTAQNIQINVTPENDAPLVSATANLYDNFTVTPNNDSATTAGKWFEFASVSANPTTIGNATQTADGTATTLNTAGNVMPTPPAGNAVYAGYSNHLYNPFTTAFTPVNPSFPTLDRSAGYSINFTAKVDSENNDDTSTNKSDKNKDGKLDRAGFNLIVISSDGQEGIELSFDSDRIWVLEDGTNQVTPSLEPDPDTSSTHNRQLFTQAESATFDTVAGFVDYQLSVQGETYRLFAGSTEILTGRLRDYTAAIIPVPLPDPYGVPNYLFLGDDTPSAQAQVKLKGISVETHGQTLNITGTVEEDQTLSVDPSILQDFEGLGAFSYQWQVLDGTTWNDIPTATNTDFTPGDPQVGKQLRVEVSYLDGQGTNETVTSAETIAVANVNDAPTFTSTGTTTGTQDTPYTYNIVTTDPDTGDSLTITGTALPSWLTLTDNGNGTATLTGTPGNADVGGNSVVLEVTDLAGATATQAFTIAVANVNDAPTALTLSNPDINENQPTGTVVGSFTTVDVDVSDVHTYSLVPGTGDTDNSQFEMFGSQLRALNPFDFEGQNSYSIRVQTDDGNGGTFAQTFTVNVQDVNEAPSFTSSELTAATEDTSYTYNIVTTDPDTGDDLTIKGTTLPSWLTLTSTSNGTATLAGTPTNDQVGNHLVELQVEDIAGLTATQTFAIAVANTNDPPEFTSTAPTSATQDSPYTYNIVTTDPDTGDSLTITGTTLPSWLTLTSTGNGTATLSGTPTSAEVGSAFNLQLQVQDLAGATATQTFSVNVDNINDPPTISGVPATSVNQDGNYSFIPTASDPDNDTLSFSIQNQPAWVSFNSATGELSGTPDNDDVGITTGIVISVNDGTVTVDLPSFDLTVNNTNDPPIALSLGNLNITENQPTGTVVGDFSTVDGDAGDAHTYSLIAGTGDTDNTQFEIVGNQLRTVTSFDFEAQATRSVRVQTDDGNGGTFAQTFILDVQDTNEAPSAVTLDNTSIPENAVGAVIGNLSASDPENNAVTFTVDDTRFEIVNDALKLKAGESLDFETEPTVNLAITATDSGNLSTSQNFTIGVSDIDEVVPTPTPNPTPNPQSHSHTEPPLPHQHPIQT
ncbi:MAG: hypothetical protein HC825_00805, partial [Oscillatoriales cyanobacterium RM1_1_9]|nr:hypothetical protein [Oscillatoriales cyanobacterium RM1_1_9]